MTTLSKVIQSPLQGLRLFLTTPPPTHAQPPLSPIFKIQLKFMWPFRVAQDASGATVLCGDSISHLRAHCGWRWRLVLGVGAGVGMV